MAEALEDAVHEARVAMISDPHYASVKVGHLHFVQA